jgi:hypothetical protein
MSSVIQIDERLQQALPAKSRLRLRRILGIAVDAESAFQSVIDRQGRIREELGEVRSQQQQAIAVARQLTDQPEDHAAAASEFDPVLAELQGELTKLEAERQKRETRRTDAAQLVAQLRSFLEQATSRNAPLTPYSQPPPALRNGESPLEAVRRVRDEIAALERELVQLRRAALPSGELRQRIRQYVSELGKAGMPSVFADGGQFRIDWPPGSQMPMGTVGPGAACVVAALFPDALVAVLDSQVERISGTGLASNDRAKREDEIHDRLLSLQRTEESLIELALDNDLDVVRRPSAAPEAVLNLRNGVARS